MGRNPLFMRLLSKRGVEELEKGCLPRVSRTNHEDTAAAISDLVHYRMDGTSLT